MKNSSRRGQRTTNNSSRSPRTTNSNSRSQRTTNSRSQSTTSTSSESNPYVSVAKNIYRDGTSYRARVSVNGIRESRNFRTKREAIQWRNEMIADRA